MILHGEYYGPGIYLAQSSRIELHYAHGANLLSNSSLGQISIVALCEVVNLPYNKEQEIEVDAKNKNTGKMEKKVLTGHLNRFQIDGIFTLTMEEALIVRFLFVNFNGHLDFLNNPPTNIPTFDDFFNYQMNELINNKCKFMSFYI